MERLNAENKWWVKYRNVKYMPRAQLSLDAILWKSFFETVKDYVKETSLTTLKHIFDNSAETTYRLVSTILLTISCVTFGYFAKYMVLDHVTDPLIVTMASSTYPITDIDFPAVAICSLNRISRKAAKTVARDIQFSSPYFYNVSLRDIEEFVHETGRLIDFSYDDSFADRYEYLINSPNRATFDSDRIIKRMEQLAPNCSEIVVRCRWASNIVECDEIFSVRRTARGHCCVFNYVLEYNSAGSKDSSSNTLAEEKKQRQAGSFHGLVLVLDLLTYDYAYPIRSMDGFEIFIFDARHYPDPSTGRVIHRMMQVNEILYFELHSTRQIATPEVKKYPDNIRKCLFRDERPEEFGQLYSYSACLIQCRIDAFLKLCRCIPYFLPSVINAPNCTFDDLHCLFKFRNKFFYLYPNNNDIPGLKEEHHDSLVCPQCLPDCEFTRYDTKAFWTPVTMPSYADKGINYTISEDMNLTDKCFVYIYQPTDNGILDILDVVSYWYEMLSTMGGMAGMLVGFSLLCIAEVIYYTLRYYVAVWNNVKLYY